MIVCDGTSNEPVRVFDSVASTSFHPGTFGEFRLMYRTGEIVSPRVEATESLQLEMQGFCRSVRGRGEPRSTAQLGFAVVWMIEAVERSLVTGGRPVDGVAKSGEVPPDSFR